MFSAPHNLPNSCSVVWQRHFPHVHDEEGSLPMSLAFYNLWQRSCFAFGGIWGQMCRVWRRHFPPHLSEARRMWQRHFPLSLYTSYPGFLLGWNFFRTICPGCQKSTGHLQFLQDNFSWTTNWNLKVRLIVVRKHSTLMAKSGNV